MIEQLISENFEDLIKEYGIEVVARTKRTFRIISLDELPFEFKEVVNQRVNKIATALGRKSFIVDNPRVYTHNERYKISGGIWDIRIL